MDQLDQKEEQYVKALKNQNDDIDNLIEHMGKQFQNMRSDY